MFHREASVETIKYNTFVGDFLVFKSFFRKYTLYSKSVDHLFVQPLHLRSTRTIITHRTRDLRAR